MLITSICANITCTHTHTQQVLCGFPVYIKFAGSSVTLLRRWLYAEEIDSDDELAKNEYFSRIHHKKCIGTMTDDFKLKSLPSLVRALTYPGE